MEQEKKLIDFENGILDKIKKRAERYTKRTEE